LEEPTLFAIKVLMKWDVVDVPDGVDCVYCCLPLLAELCERAYSYQPSHTATGHLLTHQLLSPNKLMLFKLSGKNTSNSNFVILKLVILKQKKLYCMIK
jgi:hypothetical protein